jgi:hypothetical protein
LGEESGALDEERDGRLKPPLRSEVASLVSVTQFGAAFGSLSGGEFAEVVDLELGDADISLGGEEAEEGPGGDDGGEDVDPDAHYIEYRITGRGA